MTALRIGHGHDVHRLVEGRALILGGVTIPWERGLDGHSDADVLTHAVMDALLGAIAAGDIGKLFPDNDAAFHNISSMLLLKRVGEYLRQEGYTVVNIDATLIAQAPKVSPYRDAMRQNIAAALGVDIDSLLVSQPDTGEQAMEITETMVRSGAVDIVIVDSVAALVPKAEIDGDMGDSHVGLQARLMSQALRKLTAVISKSNCIVIFINQLREKVGVMFGNPETTTGGNALKFYASVRLDIRRSTQLKDGEEVIGNQTKVKVVKNKVAPPFRKAEFDIMFGEGISHSGEIIDLGAELGIIKKSGSWYSYNDTKLGQGRDAAKVCIKDNPELAEELEGLIFEELKKK